MHLRHKTHRSRGRAGDQPAFKVTGRDLTGINHMQAIHLLLGRSKIQNNVSIEMLR